MSLPSYVPEQRLHMTAPRMPPLSSKSIFALDPRTGSRVYARFKFVVMDTLPRFRLSTEWLNVIQTPGSGFPNRTFSELQERDLRACQLL
jgi:hypothetical protein